jgi:hypothetical protein
VASWPQVPERGQKPGAALAGVSPITDAERLARIEKARRLMAEHRIAALALTIERLYRLSYLHGGTRPVRSAIEMVRVLRLSLSGPTAPDSS